MIIVSNKLCKPFEWILGSKFLAVTFYPFIIIPKSTKQNPILIILKHLFKIFLIIFILDLLIFIIIILFINNPKIIFLFRKIIKLIIICFKSIKLKNIIIILSKIFLKFLNHVHVLFRLPTSTYQTLGFLYSQYQLDLL